MAFSRRQFLGSLSFGAAAAVVPETLVQVAVGFDAKPGGGIITNYDDFWAKHEGVASEWDAYFLYDRMKMREEGFFRKIMPPLEISNDELDRQVDTDKPVKVVDVESVTYVKHQLLSPAAISIPFATLPMNLYIRGPHYKADMGPKIPTLADFDHLSRGHAGRCLATANNLAASKFTRLLNPMPVERQELWMDYIRKESPSLAANIKLGL